MAKLNLRGTTELIRLKRIRPCDNGTSTIVISIQRRDYKGSRKPSLRVLRKAQWKSSLPSGGKNPGHWTEWHHARAWHDHAAEELARGLEESGYHRVAVQ